LDGGRIRALVSTRQVNVGSTSKVRRNAHGCLDVNWGIIGDVRSLQIGQILDRLPMPNDGKMISVIFNSLGESDVLADGPDEVS